MLGVNVNRLGVGLYVLVGLLAGFVGIATASRFNASSPMAVDGMTMRLIAASVLGGCGLGGGQGSIIGGVLGLLSLNILGNAIIMLGMSPYWQKAFLGVVLLTAVLAERAKIQKRRAKKCSNGLDGVCV
jgi:ribose/xylose/arabinose/galactoside ABC-type transport system permease subunit